MNRGVYELLRTSDVLSLPAVRCVSLELYYQSQRAESCLLNFDRGNASPICEVFISCLSLSQFGLYRHELFLSIVCRISLRQEKKALGSQPMKNFLSYKCLFNSRILISLLIK